MADMKIEAADTVSNPTGGELIPVAAGQDGARTPGKVSINAIKNLTIAAIKDIAGLGSGETISADTDFVLTKRSITGGFEEKHVKLSDIAEIINGLLFSITPIPLDGSFLFTMYGGEGNGIFSTPLSDVVDFVRDNIGDVPLNISGLTAASDVADADAIPAYQTRDGQTAGNKKVTVAQLSAKAFGDIPSKAVDITTSTPAATFDNTDCILIDKGGVLKKVQLQNSGLTVGGAKAPATTATGYIPQWGNNSQELTNGLDVVSSVGPASGTGAATDSNVPTEKAVRTAIDAITSSSSSVTRSGGTTKNKIPQWNNGTGELKDGKSVVNSVAVSGSATNDNIPTEAAVREAVRAAVDACAMKPDSTTVNKIPQWNNTTGTLKDGLSLTTSDVGVAYSTNDTSVPTCLAVYNALLQRCRYYRIDTALTFANLPSSGYESSAFLYCNITNYGYCLFFNAGNRTTCSWKYVELLDSIPTESQKLSTLFYGKGSALPTTGSTVKKSQLFILSGTGTTSDGLYVAMDDAPNPAWVKLGS